MVILSPSSFKVRAERQGNGNGRVYTISFEVVDAAGNRSEQSCYVGVPHDQSPVDDGTAAGYTVTAATEPSRLVVDVNNDGIVSIFDLGIVKSQLMKPITDSNRACDVNGDGVINIFDLGVIKSRLPK